MKRLLLLTLILFPLLSVAQSFDKTRLDNYLDILEEHDKAMLSLALMKKGEIIYLKSIGYTSIEDSTAPDFNTQYRIGSITKTFTAVIIFQLIEEGKLSLETPLSEYYPKVMNSEKITISQMLGHRSGIQNLSHNESLSGSGGEPKTRAEMIGIIEALDSAFEPDSRVGYSNSAVILLGYIIEDITNDSYASQVQKRISDRLGLSRTDYGGAISIADNQAKSYNYRSGGWIPAPASSTSIPQASGVLISTPTDLTKFFTALFDSELTSDASLTKMKEGNRGVGRGLFRMPFDSIQGFGHNGVIDGFNAKAVFYESENLAVAITSNGMNYSINDVLTAVMNIYFGNDFDMPDFGAEPIQLPAGLLSDYEGIFSSAAVPIKFTIKVTDGQLTAQASGQSIFPITPYSKTEFRYEDAAITINFAKEGDKVNYDQFSLRQGAQTFRFVREEK